MNASELALHLKSYLSYRESLGHKQEQRGTLRRFVNEYARDCPGEPITTAWLLNWITADQRSAQTQAGRLGTTWIPSLRAWIFPETPIPDAYLLQSPKRKAPYIWTQDQLKELLLAAVAVRPARGLRAQAYASVIGLLVSCGLRISEALRLQEKEVHLTDEVPHIVIRETKFKKSRIVPLHPTVAERLSAYASRRDRHCHARHSAVFFVTDSGRSLDLKYMERWFSRVIDRLDLRTSSGRRPTLHSLRHTFAVSRLTQWYAEQKPVLDLIPNLSVYLGHASVADSYWYISATPELLTSAGSRFEDFSDRGGAK
jgi:integrase